MSRPICTRSISLLVALAACGNHEDAPPTPSSTTHDRPVGPPPSAGPFAPGAAPSGGTLPGLRTISPLPAGEWTMPAGDYANTRYSPLAQIDATNAGKLHITGTLTTGVPRGHEGGPLVIGTTMYVITPFPNNLIAIDLTQPGATIKWVFRPRPDPRAMGVACCDVVNRGAAFADGKIIYNLLDGHTIAVDAETGKEVWRATVGDVNLGETITMAPIVADGLVIVGNSGGELGVRGKLVALDVATGAEKWRAYSTGSDADVRIGADFKPFYAKDHGKDLGVTSWPPGQWKQGGGTVWGWISFDPETHTLFYGTGNPGVWNPDVRPGDNKWSITIFARDVKTGYAKWAYQIVPHDAWDYDEIMENVLVDMEWQGKPRKLLLHPGRTGFMFVMDRETGEVLSAEKFQPINWASAFDLKTGKPVEDPSKRTKDGVVTRGICPSSTGAKEFAPSALSPRTGLLYIPAHNMCMDYEGIEANYIEGTPYLGASVKMYAGDGGYMGELVAWDVAKGKPAWSVKDPKFPLNGGVLATGGDVVFYGTMDGWFIALDARTGAVLWKQKLGSGIVGNPITYLGPDGKQYVAVYAGVGGWLGTSVFDDVSLDDPYAALGTIGAMKDLSGSTEAGDALYIFSL